MIAVKNLHKSFRDTQAVNDVSFDINIGEVVGLLGPNGAGKTTTLRLLTGFLSPEKGKVLISNINIHENSAKAQKHIGYLPENNPLYSDMLVSEILEYSGSLKGLKNKSLKTAIHSSVLSMGLQDVFNSPIYELSKGYKQRVGIAMALLNQPKILILDEPTEGLDPNQRTEIRSLIKDLAQDRIIIISTHILQEVTAMCSRILIMHRGKLVADGSANEIGCTLQPKRVISLDIEGHNIEKTLKALPDLDQLIINTQNSNRITAKIITDKNIDLRKNISQLLHEHKWMLWGLKEETNNIEDVFRQLTNE